MGLETQKCDKVDLNLIEVKPEESLGMQKLLDMQRSFGQKFCQFNNLSREERVEWTKEFVLCMQQEIAELIEQTPWKHWKDYSSFKIDSMELKYELIDILHFWLSLCLVWGMDGEQIMKIYFSKNKQNFKRQEDGYKA